MDPDSLSKAFVDHYYSTFDTNRASLSSLYQDSSMLTFEGEKIKGAVNIVNKLTSLPFQQCKHNITTVDCQPSGPAGGMLVFVSGTMQLAGEEHLLKFSQILEVKLLYVYPSFQMDVKTLKALHMRLKNSQSQQASTNPSISTSHVRKVYTNEDVVRIRPTTRKGDVWSNYDMCIMIDGVEKARCKKCMKFYNPASNTTLRTHKNGCNAVSQNDTSQGTIGADGQVFIFDNDAVRLDFTKFVIQQALPFNHFDNVKLTEIIKRRLQPRYQHVSRTTLRSDAFKLWETAKKDIIDGFRDYKYGVSITTDTWTAPHGRLISENKGQGLTPDPWKLCTLVENYSIEAVDLGISPPIPNLYERHFAEKSSYVLVLMPCSTNLEVGYRELGFVFFFDTSNDNVFNGGSIQEYTPNSEESIERCETPSADGQILRIGGNVRTRLSTIIGTARGDLYFSGSVRTRLSTGSHDMVDTTMVHVSRIFDRFRNMRFNSLGSDYMSHADNRYRAGDQEIRTTTVEKADILGYTASSSRMAPVNHAYLCMDVTDCIIRPEIITFPNNSVENVYQSHAREDYSDTTDCRIVDNEGDSPSYIDLGNCDQECHHCGCLFWYNERLKGNGYDRRAEYHLCCGGGKIYMPPQPDPPVFIQQLLRNSHFMEHVRAYNQMFSMTSNLSLDRVALSRRRGHNEDTLNPEIVEALIHVLDEHNGLVRLFRTARDRCSAGEIPGFKIRLYNKGGVRGYELPTSDILRGIVFEDGPNSQTDFDVIIEFRGGPPQRINKLHQSYMSLEFPLLFIFGQPGFYPDLVLKPRDGGHLFQQYVVAVFYAIEQGRLDWVCNHQNDLCSDYLFGLYDVVSRGDREGIQVGSKIMLPRTFTGGPRYMYNHYLDALAICSSVHNRAEIPDPVEDPRGYKVVTELMMHGPCGTANPSASCTEKGACNKNFPKGYNENTFFDTNGHTHYRRRHTEVHIMKGESRLDNCNVVPYNRMLLLAFHAHIDVEYCGWSMLIKYLFKYIFKGPDRILAKINRPLGDASTSMGEKHIQVDEIQNYVVGRFVCLFEACWRIFDFPIHSREPAVQILNVYLENTQRVNFRERDRLDIIVNMPAKKKTTLTEWAACEPLGLLGDDKEWDIALEESTVSASSAEVRTLFAQILIYCDVSDPPKLWRKHWMAMKDDIPAKLEAILNGFGKFVKEFGLPPPPERLLKDLRNKLLMEERNYKRDMENVSLVVASSGIASLLLPVGRTTHSRFKLPLDLTDESVCHANKHNQLANLLVETDLIIWDEAPMNDRRCFEALDITLRDLMNAPEILFGGKTVVLGGDFRQTLPVKKGDAIEELIHASIAESYL
ncbi:DNA helicase [Tanacetum coccineum]